MSAKDIGKEAVLVADTFGAIVMVRLICYTTLKWKNRYEVTCKAEVQE